MNISPNRHANVLKAPATLPVELCERVLRFADLSADELVCCARSLSKASNPLSVAAQSLAVWRSWHPQSVANTYLEVCEQQPDYLVTAFLQRHGAYAPDVREDLRHYRNNLWRRPEVDVRNFLDLSGPYPGFDFQSHMLAERMVLEISLPCRRIGQASTPQAFDTAMALLRHRPDSERAYDDVLPASLCAEPEFLRQALAVRPEWLSQATPRYKNDSQFQQVAFAAVLERFQRPHPAYDNDNFPEIPAEFFANLPAMQTAVAYDPRLFRQAPESVRSDPKFLRAYRGERALI